VTQTLDANGCSACREDRTAVALSPFSALSSVRSSRADARGSAEALSFVVRPGDPLGLHWLQDLLLDRQAVPRLWFGLTRRLLQLDLPVGRVLRRARRSGGLGCPVGDVALDCDAVGAFDGSEPAATRVSRVAMAWRLRRP
jgi:hypothetical protein